jgi:hypothetical protein
MQEAARAGVTSERKRKEEKGRERKEKGKRKEREWTEKGRVGSYLELEEGFRLVVDA